MEGDALSCEAERLAEEVERGRFKEPGRVWRCPGKLRLEIVAYALQCRERGEALAGIAGRLGLAESTLSRWLRQERGEERVAGFRPVSIVPVVPAHGDGGGEAGGLTLVTPGGYRLEGLDVESAAYLLRVMG